MLNFTAIATDVAGNVSPASDAYTIIEDPSAVCYVAGTRILTVTGEQRIETLAPGDLILAHTGDELTARPVRWLGRRRIDLTAHPRPETAAPIRIRRGAIANNTPHSDLLVSPDHAIFIDGKLICARQLINGTTIWQEKGLTSVEYFHLELDMHSIVLAEGLTSESYLNTTGTRRFFGNANEPVALHPELTDGTDYPSREAGSCKPFVWDEENVRPVWQRLAERAAALGHPVPNADVTTDPALHIVVKGQKLQPLSAENGLYTFGDFALFDSAWYCANHASAAQAIAAGEFLCALHHYLCNDSPTAFDPLADFSEADYLNRYPDVADAVTKGIFPNGYMHFLQSGVFELRNPSRHIDLRSYWEHNDAVRRAVRFGDRA